MSLRNISSGNLPSSAADATSAATGSVPVANGNNAWVNRTLLPADVGITLTTSVQAADIGAASASDLNAHVTNISNPHAVTAAQVGITSSMLAALTSLANGGSSGSSSGIGGGLSNSMVYGNGSDGVCVFDGTATFGFATLSGTTYTLTRDCYLASGSSVASGITVEVACCRVFCLGKFTNNGTIQSNGVSATSQTAQAYTLASGFAPLGRPGAGGAGGNKTNGTAGSAGAGAGAGGAGGQTTGYVLGAGGASASIVLPRTSMVINGSVMASGVWTAYGRGGGGGGGTGDAANAGGSGGTGAGLVLIGAQVFINNGALNAIGGNGAPGTAGNASGGGGGGGGQVLVVSAKAITNTGTSSVAGGAGGAASGTGSAGAAGVSGIVLSNLVLSLDTVTGAPYSWIYGDGADGVCVFNGSTTFSFATLSGSTYTLTRDCYLADGSSVAPGITLVVGSHTLALGGAYGYRVFCNGVFTNNGVIHSNGLAGTQSNQYNPGTGGSYFGTIGGPSRGGAGATATGAPGYTIGGMQGGGSGGGGGKGSSAAPQGNGTGGAASNGDGSYIPRDAMAVMGAAMIGGTWQMFGGGGSGGGGTADGTNVSGNGGQGAGMVLIAAVNLVNNGQIQAVGGNGGSCSNGACGGGGGGGGGTLLFVTASVVTGSGTTSSAGGIGGTGTNTSAGSGSIPSRFPSATTDGNNGTAGAVINLLIA